MRVEEDAVGWYGYGIRMDEANVVEYGRMNCVGDRSIDCGKD